MANLAALIVTILSVTSLTNADDSAMSTNSTKVVVKKPNMFTLQNSTRLMLFMNHEKTVTFQVRIPCDGNILGYRVQVSSNHETVFSVAGNGTFYVPCALVTLANHEMNNRTNTMVYGEDVSYSMKPIAQDNLEIPLQGGLLGISAMLFQVVPYGADRDVTSEMASGNIRNERHLVFVLRFMRPIDNIFRVVIIGFVFIVTMGFGCKLDLGVVKECVKKPIAPGIGLFCQYIIMPLLGFTIAKLVPIGDSSVRLGIFVCGVCPGGGASNIYSFLFNGDVSLSITMTFISTVASIAMLPIWIYTLGTVFITDEMDITIPYLSLLQTIAIVVVPLFIGIFIKYKFLKCALRIIKFLKPITLICVLCLMTVGIYSNLYVFQLFQPQYVLAGCLLPYCGYIIGGVVAAVFKQPWTRVKTIAIETGMQNVGVAFILMMTSFPPPIGDIASVAPVASALATPIPAFLTLIPYIIYTRCVRKYENVNDQEMDVKNGDVKATFEPKVTKDAKQKENGGISNGANEKLLTKNLSSV